MIVDLRTLQPNPMRDFTVDPMDEDVIERLKQSIEQDGFWGGVVCRQLEDGIIQIGAGHHRVRAAIEAGIRTADVFVGNGNMDDAAMVRVYARENATQRGNTGTAQAGSVASAIRFIAKTVLGGVDVARILATSDKGVEIIRGQLAGEKGIGHEVIERLLTDVPNINAGTVQQALVNLKASGNYARLIRNVQEEIEREQKEALKALAKAEAEKAEAEKAEREAAEARKAANAKARAAKEAADKKRAELERQRVEAEAKLAEKRRKDADEEMKKFDALKKTRDTAVKATEAASKKPITFDFEGVARHLKNAHQIDAFRDVVTGPGIAPYLPVENQAKLAEQVVRLAKDRPKGELSGVFIRETVISLVLDVKQAERKLSAAEQERKKEESLRLRLQGFQDEFRGGCRTLMTSAKKMTNLIQEWPEDQPIPVSAEFLNTLGQAKKMIDELCSRLSPTDYKEAAHGTKSEIARR
jgi:ParB-like nuclease domain